MSSAQTNNTLAEFISQLENNSAEINFEQVMQVIKENYDYTAATFHNGDLINEAGTNEGSCKIFYFAKLNALTEAQALACFGQYYRDDVLKNPEGNDHGNIRNFIKNGWSKVSFNTIALTPIV